VAKTFSKETLAKFEDASASIPLRPLDRAFERAGLRLGKSDDGSGGARRTQFRRYVAGVNQRDQKQLQRLGSALGALIDEVAESKKEFLVGAAERDGFTFADRTFRPASSDTRAIVIQRIEDISSVEGLERQLRARANHNPKEAIAAARALVESVNQSKKLAAAPPAVRTCLQRFGDVVADLDELGPQNDLARDNDVAVRYARLAVDAAIALVAFVAETQARDASILRTEG
jgi:hypothetical protein